MEFIDKTIQPEFEAISYNPHSQMYDVSVLMEYGSLEGHEALLGTSRDTHKYRGPDFQRIAKNMTEVWIDEHKILQRSYSPQDIYIYSEPISQTSFSDIYQAIEICDGSAMALKTYRNSHFQTGSPSDITKLFFEGEVSASVHHPNINPCKGFHIGPMGNLFLVSPLQAYGSLSSYLAANPGVNKLQIFRKLASAVDYLHTLPSPILHGDIRSANIVVDEGGEPFLIDLGSAMVLDPSSGEFFPAEHATIGNIRYMPREKVIPDKYPVTLKMDVFSFASTMLEALSGNIPYHYITSDMAVVSEVLLKGNLPKRPASSQITDQLWTLMEKCWSVDPLERPSMKEVLLSLSELDEL